MPWYESTSTKIPHQTKFQAASDPYKCTLRISVTTEQAEYLKTLYTPLLQGIDPTFQLIKIEICKENENTREMSSNSIDSLPTMGLSTQALSVILFLREDAHSQLTSAAAKNYLAFPPWTFHHKIELTSRHDFRAVARQEYYECPPRHHFPLWSICSIHCGNEQLRFNIFVRNLEKMTQFYSTILGQGVQLSKPGFCLFRIYSQPGLEIQLSLKYSPCLLSEPTESTHLCFLVNDVLLLQDALPYKVVSNDDGTWWTRDPDGNTVILEQNALSCVNIDDEEDYGQYV